MVSDLVVDLGFHRVRELDLQIAAWLTEMNRTIGESPTQLSVAADGLVGRTTRSLWHPQLNASTLAARTTGARMAKGMKKEMNRPGPQGASAGGRKIHMRPSR